MSENKKVSYRTLELRADDIINEEERTIRMSFSSDDAYVPRYNSRFGEHYEVLGHEAGEMEDSFIGSGRAPLLLDHDPKTQVGVVQSVEVVDGRASALVKVSRSAAATEIWQDVVDGIRSNVSVGYYILEQKEDGKRNGLKIVRATKWRPIEVSLVSIPADETVGVGRAESSEEIATSTGEIKMSEEKKVEVRAEPQLDLEKIKREAAMSEQTRVREIAGLGSRYGMTKEAEAFIKDNKGADEFRSYVLENMKVTSAKEEVKAERSDASIGMSEREVKQFSFVRALRALTDPSNAQFRKEAAFEIECSNAAAQKRGEDARGIIVPHDVLTRDLQAGDSATGANVVATDLLAGSFIDLLRNNVMVANLGATFLTGLRGNVAIPRQTGAATAYWIATEGNAITATSTQAMDQVALTPHTLGAYTDYSRQLMLQSSVDVENFVRNDLAAVLAIAIDVAALYGSNASGQPRGLVNQVGINTPTAFAGAVPTFEEAIAMETAIATQNALMGNLAYLTDPTTRGPLKSAKKDAGSGEFVWANGEVNGYRAEASTQVTAGDVFFGNWADMLIGLWGGLDLTVDPYALSTSGGVRVIALQSCDVAVRQPKSFAFNNDTP